MPGPVVQSHADIESKCEACHTPFSQSTQDSLCLDCHKPVKADLAKGTGFHGKSPLVKGAECNLCHDDHKGRDAVIVKLDPPTFDHAVTDFVLGGAHLDLGCTDCHAKGKRWAEAPSSCFSCHDADQPHKGNLGQECESCHTVESWWKTRAYDHGKTRFPLKGKHSDVPCAACHLGEIYKTAPMDCNGCHAIQDVHRQRFGTDCQSCHAETGWKPAKFDHSVRTRFPLKGAHEKAECAACHGGEVLRPLARACFDCHKGQDVHKSQLGRECGTCHAETGWKDSVVFDHGLTRFPLGGLHVVVACESCHASPAFKDAKTTCASCHDKDDVHKGRLASRCESCHSANGWSRVTFDHGRDTTFPLTGKHAKTGCYGCHTKKNVADASLPVDCYSCHAKKDVHRGKFGRDCARCHDTTTFTTAIIRR